MVVETGFKDVPISDEIGDVLPHKSLQLVVFVHQLGGEDLAAVLVN
jgi:hypothetical protein